ncbi:MAG: T9SS type A sorting domain-containing protein [Bacteroidota bacterium]
MKHTLVFFIAVVWLNFKGHTQQFYNRLSLPQTDDFSMTVEELNGNYFLTVTTIDTITSGFNTILYKLNGSGVLSDSVFLDSCYTLKIFTTDNSIFTFSRKILISGTAESIDIRKYDENLNLIADTVITQVNYHYGLFDATLIGNDSTGVFYYSYNYSDTSDFKFEIQVLNNQLQFVQSNNYSFINFDFFFSKPGLLLMTAKNLIILKGIYFSGEQIFYKIRKNNLQMIDADTISDLENPFLCYESIVFFDSFLVTQANINQQTFPFDAIGFFVSDTTFENNTYKSFNSSATMNERVAFRAIDKTIDDKIYVGGTLNKDSWGGGVFEMQDRWLTVFKTDTSGQVFWYRNLGGDGDYFLFHLKTTSDGGVLLVGTIWDWHNSMAAQRDVVVYKLDSMGNVSFVSQISPRNFGLDVFPNPASEQIIFRINESKGPIELIVYDSYGNLVYSAAGNGTELGANVSSFRPGVYFYRVKTDTGVRSGSFVKQ